MTEDSPSASTARLAYAIGLGRQARLPERASRSITVGIDRLNRLFDAETNQASGELSVRHHAQGRRRPDKAA